MLAKNLISDEIPPLKTSDTGSTALRWMEDFKLTELPIVNNSEFLGLITESDILDISDPEMAIGNHKLSLENAAVYEGEHIYEVLQKISAYKLSCIPILDVENNYLGVISLPILIESISELAAIKDLGGVLQLEMNINDYSLSEISSIVESNDAKILSSYIQTHEDSKKMDVTIKVNKTDLSAIIQTFERYSYTIAASFHKSEMEDQMQKRYNEFIHFLNM